MSNEPQDIKDRTLEFSVRMVKFFKSDVVKKNVPLPIADQLLRSSTSIGANVEEAYGSYSQKEFASKMSISCKEARETLYWLRVIVKSELVSEHLLSNLIDEANQLVAILTTIMKRTREN